MGLRGFGWVVCPPPPPGGVGGGASSCFQPSHSTVHPGRACTRPPPPPGKTPYWDFVLLFFEKTGSFGTKKTDKKALA